jgi:hypothetical protein
MHHIIQTGRSRQSGDSRQSRVLDLDERSDPFPKPDDRDFLPPCPGPRLHLPGSTKRFARKRSRIAERPHPFPSNLEHELRLLKDMPAPTKGCHGVTSADRRGKSLRVWVVEK